MTMMSAQSRPVQIPTGPVFTETGADAPIKDASEDALGRAEFSACLARALVRDQPQHSLVVGLLGTWGSGKSSILNMVREQLRSMNASAAASNAKLDSQNGTEAQGTNGNSTAPQEAETQSPASQRPDPSTNSRTASRPRVEIISFSPWLFQDPVQLITQFLRELARVVQKTQTTEAKETGRKILEYLEAIFTGMTIAGFPLGWIGGLAGLKAKRLAKKAEKWNDPAELKESISKTLREDDTRQYVVFIDDIDRLSAPEIRAVFQLVRCIADFPGITYLLAFDPAIVVRGLAAVTEDQSPSIRDGWDYLEKIVQVPISVPMAKSDTIRGWLIDRVAEICPKVKDTSPPSRIRTMIDTAAPSIKTFRMAKRLLNMWMFCSTALADTVDEADLFAITYVQTFAPELFVQLSEHKDALTGNVEQDRTTCINKLLADLKDKGLTSERVLACLQVLLPDAFDRAPTKPKGITYPRVFDSYFMFQAGLGLAPGRLSGNLALSGKRTEAGQSASESSGISEEGDDEARLK